MIKATYKSLIELIVPEVKVHMEQRRGGGSNRELLSQVQEVERACWGGWEAFEISSLSPVKNAFSELTTLYLILSLSII